MTLALAAPINGDNVDTSNLVNRTYSVVSVDDQDYLVRIDTMGVEGVIPNLAAKACFLQQTLRSNKLPYQIFGVLEF